MSNEEFKTDDYLEQLRLEIIGGKASFIAHSQDKKSGGILVENCLENINIARESLVPRLVSYDKNPFWVSFLNGWKPRFDIVGDYKKNILKLMAVIQVIVEEVRINGVTSSTMRVVNNNIEEINSLSDEDEKFFYCSCVNAYERVDKSSILFWRLRNEFEEINEECVGNKFKEVEEETNGLKISLQEKSEEFEKKATEIKSVLEAMRERAGFLSLYAGFDKYAKAIKEKLKFLFFEKVVWISLISLTIVSGLKIGLNENDIGWFYLTPLVGLVLFFSMLLRVNLKKTDQYEQIMSKVEHKLAVSTFYQSELESLKDMGDKEKINEEYYRFLFSDIETTEWNTPDIASDIAKVLKSYKG
ncbi:hypothetical protein [Vreelandella venusta]|uniref:hypothetical protein n=1 Tax=Vreelandella venusta TaxID=44935 RepID=UPI003F67C869